MRVLFIHSPADLYGASRSLIRLCADMRQNGYQIATVLNAEGSLSELLRGVGVEVFVYPGIAKLERQNIAGAGNAARFFWSMVTDITRQARLIAAWKPDVVHTNVAIVPASGLAAMLARRPHLWHVRETFVEFPTLWRWYRHYMSAFSTRLVCNSRGTAAQFAGTRGQNRTRVVYNGLSSDDFCRFTQAEVDAWRQRLSPNGGPVVGVVGRIKLVRKGQEVFLEAARRLAERFPEARFVCIGGVFPGNESHFEELDRRIQSAGMANRFWVTGDIDDVGPATAALDIAVMPSVIPEPFGNVVMEAMCLGKPVVASGNGGAAEQIEHGVTGLLVPPGDAEALADALAQLLEDPARATAMGAAGKQRFNALFSSEQTYAAIRRLHEELGLV